VEILTVKVKTEFKRIGYKYDVNLNQDSLSLN